MKFYEAVAQALVAEEVGPIFGLMGDGNMYIWGALARHESIKIHSARHEATAVAMADGYSRASRNVGVATITWGPGVTQAMTPMMMAARNGSAVVMVIGIQAKDSPDPHQALDHRRYAEMCGLYYIEIATLATAAKQMAEAFHIARNGQKPVFLAIPMDLQLMEVPHTWRYAPAPRLSPRGAQIVPAPEQVDDLFAALSTAARPVLVAGRGVMHSPGAREAIIALGDRAGALLATTLPAKGMFSDQPWDIGISGGFSAAVGAELLSQADLIVTFGASLAHFTTEGGKLYRNARVIRIDSASAPDTLGDQPVHYVQGDAGLCADALLARFRAGDLAREGYRSADVAARLSVPATINNPADDGLDPRLVMQAVGEALPQGARIVGGVGHFWGFIAQYLAVPPDADLILPYQFGSIAQALGQGMGASHAEDGRPLIVIEGDGSLLCHIQDIASAVRAGRQMTLLVMNDSGFGAEVHKLKAKGFDPSLAQWEDADIAAIARTFGATVHVPQTETEVGTLIADCIAAGGVQVIDIRISPSVVSDTYQKAHLGGVSRAPILRSRAP